MNCLPFTPNLSCMLTNLNIYIDKWFCNHMKWKVRVSELMPSLVPINEWAVSVRDIIWVIMGFFLYGSKRYQDSHRQFSWTRLRNMKHIYFWSTEKEVSWSILRINIEHVTFKVYSWNPWRLTMSICMPILDPLLIKLLWHILSNAIIFLIQNFDLSWRLFASSSKLVLIIEKNEHNKEN